MYIPRLCIDKINRIRTPGKAILIYGARRVGKTTVIKKFVESLLVNEPALHDSILLVNGDDIVVQQSLGSQSIQKLKEFIGQHTLLIIDEAQYVQKIGLNLKLIVDHLPNLSVIATGSSSFEIAQDIGEPLTGRKFVISLFPLAQHEIGKNEKRHQTIANLESRLIYGSYPEIITNNDQHFREMYLRELVNSYLFKDILVLLEIRKSNKLVQLLQLLAFQIGKEVSYNELGTQLGMSKNTVEKYLDLLEKVFVIKKIKGFSRNLRKEITKNPRYYFYDVGIRNALINNFSPFAIRNDVGQIWENYIIMERIKLHENLSRNVNYYFWRTYDQHEIDLIEESQGNINAYEIKWGNKKVKIPNSWKENYPNATYTVIDKENYLDYIL